MWQSSLSAESGWRGGSPGGPAQADRGRERPPGLTTAMPVAALQEGLASGTWHIRDETGQGKRLAAVTAGTACAEIRAEQASCRSPITLRPTQRPSAAENQRASPCSQYLRHINPSHLHFTPGSPGEGEQFAHSHTVTSPPSRSPSTPLAKTFQSRQQLLYHDGRPRLEGLPYWHVQE